MIALVAACGGKAIVDPVTDGGGGGATSSGADTGASGFSTSITTSVASTSTGMLGSFCDVACDSFATCDADLFECEERCESAPAACRALQEEWVSCSLAATGTMCGLAPGQDCGGRLADYLECRGINADEQCELLGPDCYCEDFSNAPFSQFCTEGQGCECYYGDGLVGRCDPGLEACGIVNGCCAGLFFLALLD